VVVLFIFTFDDSLFPRHVLQLSTANSTPDPAGVTETNEVVSTMEVKESKTQNIIQQDALAEGNVDPFARNYWHVLAPIHRFKQDKSTWWQYFRRPFFLFLFPNIVVVRSMLD
jgi:hypothetical protein